MGLRRYVFVVFQLAIASAVPACRASRTEPCDICTTSAIVTGTVVDSLQQPIPGLEIDVYVFGDTCDSAVRGWDMFWDPRTNSDGRFFTTVSSRLSPFTSNCIAVVTNPSRVSGSPFTTTYFPLRLEMRPDDRAGPKDSVAVIVRVP